MNDSTFQREDRYIVIKHTDMEKLPHLVRRNFSGRCRNFYEQMLIAGAPARRFLVIESDWPEYEPVWQMIERRMAGQPPVTAAEELEAVLHWRDKHAVAIKERDALQQRLNAADQRIDDLAAAAEPFAKVADLYAGEEDNSHVPARDFGMHDDLRLALGQFRALRDLCIRPLMVGCKNGILCGDVSCECKGNGFVEQDHQIPGTSGVRLNMLANQGE